MSPIVFTEPERKVLAQTLEFEWIRRDIGMATDDEVKENPVLCSAIKKLMILFDKAKESGLCKFL